MIERFVLAAAWTLLLGTLLGAVIAAASAGALRALRAAAPGNRFNIAAGALAILAVASTVLMFVLLRGGTVAATSLSTRLVEVTTSINAIPATVALLAPALVVSWLAGAMLLLGRVGMELCRVERVRREAGPPPPELTRALARVEHVMSERRARLAVHGELPGPCVAGIRRAIVLVPPGFDEALSREHVELLLAHELAHIRRHDLAVNALARVASAIWWMNPAVWWLGGIMRRERELACDRMVVDRFRRPLVLARALERLETSRSATVQPLGLAAADDGLMARVTALLQPPADLARRDHGPAAAAIAGGILASLALLAQVPADLVDASLLARAPAARTAQRIDAVDAAGPFVVSVVGLRATAASFGGAEFPRERIVQRGASVQFRDAAGRALLVLELRPEGGMRWNSRAAPAGR